MAIKVPDWLKTGQTIDENNYGWDYKGFKEDKKNYVPLTPPPLPTQQNFRKMNNSSQAFEPMFEGLPPLEAPTLNNKTFYSNKGTPITFNNTADDKAGKAGSFTAGLTNGLSLGVVSALLDKLQPGMSKEAEESNKLAYNLGNIGGYIAPGVAGAKAVKPLLSKVTNPLLNRIAEGALVGSGMTAIEDTVKGKSLEETGKDIALNGALGAGIDLGLYGLGKGIPKLINSALPDWKTTFESNANLLNPKNKNFNQILPTKKIEYETAMEQVPKVSSYKAPLPKVNDTLPLEARDFKNVTNKKVNAYQYDHPEIKPYIQQEANILKGEIKNTIKGGRSAYYNDVTGENIVTGNKKFTSQSIQEIQDITKASYKQIEKALDDIIKDHGKENKALPKKIELIIDDRLSNGYNNFYDGTDIPKDANYLYEKSLIGKKYETIPMEKGYIEKPYTATKETIINERKPIKPLLNTNPVKEDIKSIINPIKSEVAATTTPKINTSYNTIIDETGIPRAKNKIVSSSKADPLTFKEALDKFYTRVVDSNNPLKPIGDKTYTLATNSKNVGGTVDYILKDALVDRNGKKIGEGFKAVVQDIPKGEESKFWEYVLQRHNIDRANQGSNIYPEFTSEQSKQIAEQFERAYPKWKEKADNITNWIDTFMKEWGVNAGTVDKDLYDNLRKTYSNYVPTQRDFSTLEAGINKTNGKGFINQTTPLNKATGSNRDIINPVENIMNLVNRTVRTAKYNEVGQSMLKEIRKEPDKFKYVIDIIPEGTEINPNVKNIVSVLENGKPVNIQVKDKELLDTLQGLYKNNTGDIEAIAKKATGLFKSLITQKNPVFAIRNIARDLPTAYINGSEKNPLKFGKDLLAAGKDILTNGEALQQYKGLGGGGSNFFNSNNVAKSAKELTNPSLLKKIGNGIETFNNLTETAPRLAEFKRVAKTGDLDKAMFAANDVTTNFSRSGDLTKTIDSYVPYLNAGIQGLDKLARQFKDKPIATILKGATAITAPTLILNHVNKDNPNYQALDNRTKDNYYLFPKEDGTFIKIPKTRELGVIFSTLTERVLRNDFKDFGNTVKTNFAPANPFDSNILSPVQGLKSNKDFANRDIVPRNLQDLSPKYQYDEKTTELAKKIGEIANISPKQVDYIIRSYSGVVAQLGQPLNTKSIDSKSPLDKVLKPITSQFKADPLYNNQSLSDFYNNYDKIKTLAADKNFTENINSKIVTDEESIRNKFSKISTELSDFTKRIKEAEKNGDTEAVKRLRAFMIQKANDANKLMNK